jgi:tRNA1Val (adenine37-N6)-methyltransferase
VEPFRFKQFTVKHDRSAMHVNTDSVLLGAWTSGPAKGPARILDIGTGCGILALMMAQRFGYARIDALEIDENSAAEAAANVSASPWADRIRVIKGDFREHDFTEKYDLIISNPPYFSQSLVSPNVRRTRARHSYRESLPHGDLLSGVADLLTENGFFAFILPAGSYRNFIFQACLMDKQLFPGRITMVRTKKDKPAIRVLSEMGKTRVPVVEDTITIYTENEEYTQQYIRLVRDFYLWA